MINHILLLSVSYPIAKENQNDKSYPFAIRFLSVCHLYAIQSFTYPFCMSVCLYVCRQICCLYNCMSACLYGRRSVRLYICMQSFEDGSGAEASWLRLLCRNQKKHKVGAGGKIGKKNRTRGRSQNSTGRLEARN